MKQASSIGLLSSVQRLPGLAHTEMNDDLVILSVEKSSYYGTHLVGKRIWEMIGEIIRVDHICDNLMKEYDVDRKTCEEETLVFLQQLLAEGLIKVI